MEKDERPTSGTRASEVWSNIRAPMSWISGIALFVYVTVTGRADQSPAWYVVIFGLLGFPFVGSLGDLWRSKGGQQ